MRLVLQCSVCGTIQGVGAVACDACRAAGLQNLRLMFECGVCFKLGLSPTCSACAPAVGSAPLPAAESTPAGTHEPAPLIPAVVVPDDEELARLWGVEEPPPGEYIAAEVVPEEYTGAGWEEVGSDCRSPPSEDFELRLDASEIDLGAGPGIGETGEYTLSLGDDLPPPDPDLDTGEFKLRFEE